MNSSKLISEQNVFDDIDVMLGSFIFAGNDMDSQFLRGIMSIQKEQGKQRCSKGLAWLASDRKYSLSVFESVLMLWMQVDEVSCATEMSTLAKKISFDTSEVCLIVGRGGAQVIEAAMKAAADSAAGFQNRIDLEFWAVCAASRHPELWANLGDRFMRLVLAQCNALERINPTPQERREHLEFINQHCTSLIDMQYKPAISILQRTIEKGWLFDYQHAIAADFLKNTESEYEPIRLMDEILDKVQALCNLYQRENPQPLNPYSRNGLAGRMLSFDARNPSRLVLASCFADRVAGSVACSAVIQAACNDNMSALIARILVE